MRHRTAFPCWSTKPLIADDDLLHRELQHRVANSLQIIASVLMRSARRASLQESRKAHNRVMSIAEVQGQLASTGADSVALKPYLTQPAIDFPILRCSERA